MTKRFLLPVLSVVALLTTMLFVLYRENDTQFLAGGSKPLEFIFGRFVEPSALVSNVRKRPEDSLSVSRAGRVPELVLSGEVKALLALNTSFAIRSQIIKDLSRCLANDDVKALRGFLNVSVADYPNLEPIALNSLKNDLLEVLMDQRQLPVGLGQQVVEMFNDPSTDAMWREYCLQFLQPLYERCLAESMEHGAERSNAMPSAPSSLRTEQEAVLNALYAALDERDQELAGTALLGLDRLAKKYDQFDREAISAQAVEMAADPNASDRCRLTALRVAASSGNEKILLVARQLSMNAKTDLLRAAAITTLGEFCVPEDTELLVRLSFSSNRQIAAAAQAALAKRR
jgi:hypothetical protein